LSPLTSLTSRLLFQCVRFAAPPSCEKTFGSHFACVYVNLAYALMDRAAKRMGSLRRARLRLLICIITESISMAHFFPFKLQATYLLHDIDLDPKAGGLGFLMKVNPQHQLFSSMKLFLEAQVRALSYSRHGGADGLAAETRRRKAKAQEAKAARRLAQDSALSAPAEGRKRRAQTSSRHIDVAAAIRAAIESAHVCNFQPARASSAASQPSRAQGAREQLRVMECVCGASYELTVLVPRVATVVID
jgi:hypothetical protein